MSRSTPFRHFTPLLLSEIAGSVTKWHLSIIESAPLLIPVNYAAYQQAFSLAYLFDLSNNLKVRNETQIQLLNIYQVFRQLGQRSRSPRTIWNQVKSRISHSMPKPLPQRRGSSLNHVQQIKTTIIQNLYCFSRCRSECVNWLPKPNWRSNAA